jgi:putative SbcD/Mre11-related phosphoesterase
MLMRPILDDWLLTPHRVAVHRPTATAVAADLHLGYAEARRRGGEAVPVPSLDDLLVPLRRALDEAGVRRLVVAGDLFEAGARPELVAGLVDWIVCHGVELVAVVPGNHDRGLKAQDGLPVAMGAVRLGDWLVVHGDGELPAGRVVHGHVHPCLRLRGAAVPCYLIREARLVLPAYSAEAAGVDVRDGWDGLGCHAIVGGRVLQLGDMRDLRKMK